MDSRTATACAEAHLGPGVTITPTPTGKFNSSFFATAGDEDFVLRIAPPDDATFVFYERRMMHQEPDLHEVLRRQTDVPVPEVVAFDDSRRVVDRDFILMRRLPGVPMSLAGGVNHSAICAEVGAALRQVHAITRPEYGYLGAHRPMAPQSSWPAAFRVMWGKLLDDVVATGHYTATQADGLRDLLDSHADAFAHDVPACLLHMDVWSQNILVDGGRLSGLVDWDRGLWGDPEIEMAVLEYCGILTPGFWRGYAAPPPTGRGADIRRVFYLLYEHQKYIVIRHGRSHDPAAAARYARESLAMAARAFDL